MKEKPWSAHTKEKWIFAGTFFGSTMREAPWTSHGKVSGRKKKEKKKLPSGKNP